LSETSVLEAQVRRMLADQRSQAHGEELPRPVAVPAQYRAHSARPPRPSRISTKNLRHAMATETEMLVESTLREDRSVGDLLSTDYTSSISGSPSITASKGIYGTEFRRISLSDPKRHGLLGQASILTVTSYPNRTAPTIRGKWVLEADHGNTAAPPPPNVPSLKEDATHKVDDHAATHGTAQGQSELRGLPPHDGPACFSLENFDGLGRLA